jgi:hypothetical protein
MLGHANISITDRLGSGRLEHEGLEWVECLVRPTPPTAPPGSQGHETSELTSLFDPATLLTSVVEVDTTHIAKQGFRDGTN